MLYDQELFKSGHSHHFVGITAVAETRARKKNHTAAGAQLLALQSKPLYMSHSMATANLKKSKDLVKNTNAASKYIPRRPRISIN